ncbi:hypothetical protein F5X99DRAFT_431084 [Biscogniauxia marginata]|nr:hypothetical protein F5X99DRAFT_431084 [Biscogniauxia marginata]
MRVAHKELDPFPAFLIVRQLSLATFLKSGPTVRPAEAKLLQHLALTTSIPVPRVLSWARDSATGHWGIEMERVDAGAIPLDAVYDDLCRAAKTDLTRQLRWFLEQLRGRSGSGSGRCRSRAGWIGSFDGRLGGDRFLDLVAGARGEAAPHWSEGEFLADVADAVRRRGPPRSVWSDTVARLLRDLPRWRREQASSLRSTKDENSSSSSSSLLPSSYSLSLLPVPSTRGSIIATIGGEGGEEEGSRGKFVLTHADLTPEHILVRYDGYAIEIVGIVGWGQAGYYPEYYEYVKMNFWDAESRFIGDRVADRVLKPWLPELSVFLHARDIIW